MPRYLLIVDFQPGDDATPMSQWAPAELDAHLAYYGALNEELRASGELVGGEILAGPDQAAVVRSGARGTTVSDGPFVEVAEWIAGYQIVEVASRERALEIAARVSAVPGPGGVPLGQPVQVREVIDLAPSNADEMRDYLETATSAEA
jgi:hypothetical protein